MADRAMKEEDMGGGVTMRTPLYENVLEEALAVVNGPRAQDYGHPMEDATRWAAIASAATGLDIKPEHFPIVMMAVKLSRLYHTPGHRDSLVDIAGYSRVAEMIHERLAERDQD